MDTTQVLICNSATERPHSHIIKSDSNYYNTVEWISHNRLACGYDDGTIEIHEMESLYSKSNQIFQIRHDLNDNEQVHLFRTASFYCPTLESYSAINENSIGRKMSDVLSIVWNNEFNLLASGGRDKQVKVLNNRILLTGDIFYSR